jgi:hypothetical protein
MEWKDIEKKLDEIYNGALHMLDPKGGIVP